MLTDSSGEYVRLAHTGPLALIPLALIGLGLIYAGRRFYRWGARRG